MIKLHRLAIVLLMGTVLGISAFAQKPETAPTPKPTTKEARDVTKFPDVDGWEKGDLQYYPTPAMGFSVNYDSRIGGRVTVYIYDNDNPSIPDGISSKIVKQEIENTKEGIKAFVDMGYYDEVKELKSDSFKLGGKDGKVEALRVVMKIKAGGNDLTSEVYMFGLDNNFIKFRATRAEEIVGLENKALADLLTALDKHFSK